MPNKKVHKGQLLYYFPTMMDRIDPKTDLKEGEKVRVIHPNGCPSPNTMGHCHVERVSTGKFVGLVCTNSLHTEDEMKEAGKPIIE